MNAATAFLPLPFGERAGVRGHAGHDLASERASINVTASTRPSPQSSPRRGEEANAKSLLMASTRPSSGPSGHLLPGGEKGLCPSEIF